MKILYINNCHYKRGGADVVYFNTAQLFEENGHEVVFFSQKNKDNLHDKNSDLFAEQVNYRELSMYEKIKESKNYIYNKNSAQQLERLLRKEKPDVVHMHLFLGSLSVSILKIIKEKRIPIIMTVHDYRLLCPANSFLDNNNNICEKCIDGVYLRCGIKKCSEKKLGQSLIVSMEAYFRKHFVSPIDYVDVFVFVSRFIKEKHCHFNLNYQIKSEILYNFIPTFDEDLKQKNSGYILFFGRVSVEKGVNTLLKSYQNIARPLKIVGDGPLLDSLKDENNNKNIEFLGYKSGEELESLKKNASFIVVPSEWYENNPLSVLEAYSYGKPVIASNIGGIPEIVVEEKTGFLFESADTESLSSSLGKAINMSDEEYEIMSNNCIAYAKEKFGKQKHYQELLRIYSGLITN